MNVRRLLFLMLPPTLDLFDPYVKSDNLEMFSTFVYSRDRWSRGGSTLRHSARHVHRLPHAQEGRGILRSR